VDLPREEAERLRLVGRVAGLSFLVFPLLTIPLYVGLGGDDAATLVPLWVATAVAGAVVAAVPADRAPSWWFPAFAVVATGLCIWGSIVTGEFGAAAVWPYLIVAALIALSVNDLSVVAGLTALLCGGMLVGLALGDLDNPGRAATLLAMPVIVGMTAIIATLRRRERAIAARLRGLASTDALTEIGNRRRLNERLDYELRRHRRSGRRLGLYFVDLDAFKAVNDEVGHVAGDELLREAAAAIVGAVRASDTVARYGGDEFAVLAPDLDDGAQRLADAITAALATVHVAGRSLTASVGWAQFPDDALTAEDLLTAADEQERCAKRARRS
jgi:diguanylate cyclase (GGDEF)-like protein